MDTHRRTNRETRNYFSIIIVGIALCLLTEPFPLYAVVIIVLGFLLFAVLLAALLVYRSVRCTRSAIASDHPFMTSTQRGRGGAPEVNACGQGRGEEGRG